MTNISREKIHTEDFKLAHRQLIDLIAKLNQNTSQYLIQELLSDAEQIMIVKRFAAVFMFKNKYSSYRVSETLSISTSSARRLQLQFENGQFNNLLGCIKKKEANSFLVFISDLIAAQASPRARARLMNRALGGF
jgi:uncharacterized protein YerC